MNLFSIYIVQEMFESLGVQQTVFKHLNLTYRVNIFILKYGNVSLLFSDGLAKNFKFKRLVNFGFVQWDGGTASRVLTIRNFLTLASQSGKFKLLCLVKTKSDLVEGSYIHAIHKQPVFLYVYRLLGD